jgi:hypothetical protein
VRYRSPREALVDVAASVASGDLERAWAWRRLGLWDEAEMAGPQTAGEALVRALAAQPEAIVAAVAAVAAAGGLGGLVRAVDGPGWQRLAAAALRSAGADERLADDAYDVCWRPPADRTADRGEPIDMAHASPLLRAAAGIALAPAGRWTLPALAVLAALDAEPGLGHASSARARDAVLAVASALRPADPLEASQPEPFAPAVGPSASIAAGDAAEPAPTARRPAGDADADEPGALADSPADEPGSDDPGALGSDDAGRASAPTALGGLLFLLHLVGELGLPEAFLAAPALAARPLRWSLHRLALELTGADPVDPAALAFAGLVPGTDPPSSEVAPPDEREAATLRVAAEQLAAALAEALGPDAGNDPVTRVCRRDAHVLADPGWIELHLSSESVDLDVRRAGLDIDPDYVAWLGVVVRFVYD